jgi:hypothetical protein
LSFPGEAPPVFVRQGLDAVGQVPIHGNGLCLLFHIPEYIPFWDTRQVFSSKNLKKSGFLFT